jgi:hypothetical protein
MKEVNENMETTVNKDIKKNQRLTDKLTTTEEIVTCGMKKQESLNKNLEYYIARHEAKLIKEFRKKIAKERNDEKNRLLQEEKEKCKKLHYMKCPQCGIDLHEAKFMCNTIWACEECFGMWLNKGNFEHITEEKAGFFYKIWNKKH